MLQNLLIARARVMASTILGAVKSLVVNLESLVGDTSTEEPMFGALGVVARPKPPPDTANGLHPEGECEALAIKDEDGMQPFAYRDLRLTARLPTIEEGDIFLKRIAHLRLPASATAFPLRSIFPTLLPLNA
jgi:hypothetical protein